MERLQICEQAFNSKGVFVKECLFEKENSVDKRYLPQVESCVNDSFEIPGDYESNNMMLETDSKWAKDHHLDFHPSITINDFTYRGDIEFADIREAICAAYQKRPDHCNLDKIWENEAS